MAFLTTLINAAPYRIDTVLTDCPKGTLRRGGILFTFPPGYANGRSSCSMTHMFDMRYRENGIQGAP